MKTNRELFFSLLGQTSPRPLALEVERAAGIYLITPEGKKVVDLISGVSVSNTGHCHPAVIRAIEEQSGKFLHLMVYGEIIQTPQVMYAEKLVSILPPGLQSVYFVNSGSEAIEGAMKLAKRFTGRKEILAFHNSYHGSTQGALSVLGNDTLKKSFEPLLPGIGFMRFNQEEDLDMISSQTACVILELVQAEAGIRAGDQHFIRMLYDKCRNTGTLLVIDEVQTGFGRTGKMFCFEHYGLVPDILVLAKGMGGGLPLGAFISSQEIMNSLTHDPALGHITTFGGHPLSCAAAMASLNVIIQENLASMAESKGRIFEELIGSHPAVKEIRRNGLFMAIELQDPELAEKIVYQAPAFGFMTDMFLFCPQAFRIAPPLIITEKEIRMVCDRIIHCLNDNSG